MDLIFAIFARFATWEMQQLDSRTGPAIYTRGFWEAKQCVVPKLTDREQQAIPELEIGEEDEDNKRNLDEADGVLKHLYQGLSQWPPSSCTSK
jgi:hypothetical protein